MLLALDLAWTFFKLGLFTFGGGYAMLPLLQREVVDKKAWATEQQLLDYYAIGQSTPGIIAVNTATFVGFSQAGIIGAITATLGLVLPSLTIITIIATVLQRFMDVALLQHAFGGIRVAVVALVCTSVYRLGKVGITGGFTLAWALLTFISIAFLKISPLWVVLGSFVVGNLLPFLRRQI